MKSLRCFLVLASLALFAGGIGVANCAGNAPPSLSPTGKLTYQANEGVVALGTVQHAAIELNKVQACTSACHPLLPDKDVAVVVDNVTSALIIIKQVPNGWKATIISALNAISTRLDAEGKMRLSAYLGAAIAVVNALQ
jgi:hypothetical protein